MTATPRQGGWRAGRAGAVVSPPGRAGSAVGWRGWTRSRPPGAHRSPRGERGHTSGFVLIAAVVIAATAWVGIVAGAFAVATQRARSAADLAALAGARALLDGTAPCPASERIARANQAVVVSCGVEGQVVTVRVEVASPIQIRGLPERVAAEARAAPVP